METNNTKCHFVFLKQQRNINRNNSPQLTWQTNIIQAGDWLVISSAQPLSCNLYLLYILYTLSWINRHWGWICSDIHGVIKREYQNKSIKSISVSDCLRQCCASSSDCLTEIWYKYTTNNNKVIKYLNCAEVETLRCVLNIQDKSV